MKRIVLKSGDIFEVPLKADGKFYFQFLQKDPHELNSDVIRVFRTVYQANDSTNPDVITSDEILFHTHVYILLERRENEWERIGNAHICGPVEQVGFRSSEDYGDPKIKISENWWIWNLSDDKPTRIGKMKKDYVEYDLGGVWPASAVTELVEKGTSTWVYPGYKIEDANQSCHTTPASAPR